MSAKRTGWILGTLLLFPASALSQDVSWFINDGPDAGGYKWSDTGMGPFWEYMSPTALEDDACSVADLPYPPPVGNDSYYACTVSMTADYSGYMFWGELWLANNYANHSNAVRAELRRGSVGGAGTLLAQSTVTVTNYPTPQKYTFSLGSFDTLLLADEALVLRIIYTGLAGDAHIYWDSVDCPSALHGKMVTIPIESETWGRIKATYW